MLRTFSLALLCSLYLGLMSPQAFADCCGPVQRLPNELPLAPGWSGSVQYEHMDMRTLLQGSEKVSGDQILTQRLESGAGRYSIPTRMFMDRASLQMRYQFDETHSFRVSVPWRFNQMDMRGASRPGIQGGHGHGGHGHGGGGHHRSIITHQDPEHHHHSQDSHHGGGGEPQHGGHGGSHDQHPNGGHHHQGGGQHQGEGGGGHSSMGAQHGAMPAGPTFMDMTMQQVDGLGDVQLSYNYEFDLDGAHAWLGGGVLLPTGEWSVRDGSGQLVHNMMQPGGGSLGLLGEFGADFALGEDSKFSIHPRLGLLWNARNPLGYQRGARLDYEVGTRYQLSPALGLSLDFVGFLAGQDSTNGTIDPRTGQVAFQRPETSLVDNVANTGGEFHFLAPGIRFRPTDDIFLGFQYRLPIYQEVRGTQLGIDRWYRAFMSARF